MNAVTILKGNPDQIKDICKKLFAPKTDKNGMLYIQSKNNLHPNQTISDSTVALYLDTPGHTIKDHPFKMSACLRRGGVSPCADGQKVTVHKDQKSPS